jgi:photosystem II stability/assembly factor-like uncharacterized protein
MMVMTVNDRDRVLKFILAAAVVLSPLVLVGIILRLRPSPSRVAPPIAFNAIPLSRDAPPSHQLYFPLIIKNEGASKTAVIAASVQDDFSQIQTIYQLGDPINYIATLNNPLTETVSAQLSWSLQGPCGTTEIYTNTLNLEPGVWGHTNRTYSPACAGVYTATARLFYESSFSSQTTNFEIHFPSQVQVSTRQAFDRCNLPTVEEMQSWWNESPYFAFNLYLGGVHFPCSLENLTPIWLQTVAAQGWEFIFTWVGPQAACSNFIHKMSLNPVEAFGQGIDEAAAALAAAAALGLSDEIIIYYDLEAYSGADTECRAASKAFIQGWTQWLQLQGDKAGVYGSPCNSYLSDWATNSPPPDDVWIAHWLLPAKYRSDASVFDVACMSNDFWPDNQRLRQYAGDHAETWGSVALTIDSNILGGEITVITPTVAADAALQFPQIQDIGLVSSETGWVVQGNRLLLTSNFGISWQDISPAQDSATFLETVFLDTVSGWLLAYLVDPSSKDDLIFLNTQDGGTTWEQLPTPKIVTPIAALQLDFIDPQTGWLLIEHQTGSSFSKGQLFFTTDGGHTWAEREIPVSGTLDFSDVHTGQITGGPQGDKVFLTTDGGQTWALPPDPSLPSAHTNSLDQLSIRGLPQGLQTYSFVTPQTGWALVKTNACQGTKIPRRDETTVNQSTLSCGSQTRLFATTDGGYTWTEITP